MQRIINDVIRFAYAALAVLTGTAGYTPRKGRQVKPLSAPRPVAIPVAKRTLFMGPDGTMTDAPRCDGCNAPSIVLTYRKDGAKCERCRNPRPVAVPVALCVPTAASIAFAASFTDDAPAPSTPSAPSVRTPRKAVRKCACCGKRRVTCERCKRCNSCGCHPTCDVS